MKIQILNRWTLEVQFEHEISAELETASPGWRLGEAIKSAYKCGVALRGAALRGADLSDAALSGDALSGADLSGADLSGADLSGADLSGADLSGAALRGADLSDADLSGAALRDADLSGAALRGADLSDADLRDAALSGAALRDADLSGIKNDFFSVLLHAKNEVGGLADALRAGKVNGAFYEGECACLVGTIANVKHCKYDAVPGLIPDSSRPAEKWFLNIAEGDMPDNSDIVKITVEWIAEFQELMAAK